MEGLLPPITIIIGLFPTTSDRSASSTTRLPDASISARTTPSPTRSSSAFLSMSTSTHSSSSVSTTTFRPSPTPPKDDHYEWTLSWYTTSSDGGIVTASTRIPRPGATGSLADEVSRPSPHPFFSNRTMVAIVFTIVSLVCLAIFVSLFIMITRWRRKSRLEKHAAIIPPLSRRRPFEGDEEEYGAEDRATLASSQEETSDTHHQHTPSLLFLTSPPMSCVRSPPLVAHPSSPVFPVHAVPSVAYNHGPDQMQASRAGRTQSATSPPSVFTGRFAGLPSTLDRSSSSLAVESLARPHTLLHSTSGSVASLGLGDHDDYAAVHGLQVANQ